MGWHFRTEMKSTTAEAVRKEYIHFSDALGPADDRALPALQALRPRSTPMRQSRNAATRFAAFRAIVSDFLKLLNAPATA